MQAASSQARKNAQPETDTASRVEHLRAVALFSDIAGRPEALASLAGMMQSRRYAPDAAILREGEIGTEFFVLIEGQAGVFKSTAEGEPYKVATLSGERHVFFGEGGLLDSDARSATIRAESTCLCLVLSREAFERFCRESPDLALPVLVRIARAVMARLRNTNTDLMLLYKALVAEIRGN